MRGLAIGCFYGGWDLYSPGAVKTHDDNTSQLCLCLDNFRLCKWHPVEEQQASNQESDKEDKPKN